MFSRLAKLKADQSEISYLSGPRLFNAVFSFFGYLTRVLLTVTQDLHHGPSVRRDGRRAAGHPTRRARGAGRGTQRH